MAAELRLGVSFDLVYFRQQLQKLSQIAASEFTAPIKIKLDRRVVDQELNNLQRLFSRRQYTIRLNDQQVQAAVDRVSSLQRSLVSLRRATATPIEIKVKYTTTGDAPGKGAGGAAVRRAVGSQNLTEGASRADLQALYKFAREAQIPFEQLKRGAASSTEELRRVLGPAFRGIGKDVKGGITAGLADANSQLARLGAQMGDSLLSAVKKQLGIASPSREFKKIGEDSGEGFEQGLESGLNEATRVGVREMRDLFRSLQREAQAGTMKLAALMQGAMAGVVQLPGGRQQRGRLMQTGAAINARMAGPVVPNIVQRQSAVRGQAASAGTATPAFLSALPLMLGMSQRELLNNLTGLSGQSYRAPEMGGRQAPRPGRIASLLDALASSRGGIGGGLSSLVSTRGGLTNPGLASAGYIGRTALSPQYVNYPPGMPAAYGAGFTGAASGSFSMARQAMQGPMLPTRGIFAAAPAPAFGSLGQFPTAGMAYPSSPRGSMGQFPMAGMAYPSSPLGRITPQSSMFAGGGPPAGGGGGGGLGGFGGMGGAFGNVPGLPGRGLVREIGEEFGFAAKQVLLFGTAYKAIAFLTNFPAQVTQAVSALQTYQNTLNAITPSAQDAASANQLILDLVDKYNVPLASAREGFTRLYASMAPAGFNGEQITSLFTGITQAAATFGMSADKVDRVNYAFAQMASKGQVMSEELKGQLGDVLPGAMGIFAEAAGFKGPEAIQKFSKALEDGTYKGDAMVKLLDNVGVVMQKEFGPGAEGAARTFQGVINRLQNSMRLLYESFEPVAVGFLNSVVVPFTDGIKTITDGFNAFFTGASAKTAGGFAFAQELEKLRPTFAGLAENAKQVGGQLLELAKVGLEVGKVFLQIAANPVVGYLAKLYVIALPLNMALTAMRALWVSNALQIALFNARVATGTGVLTAFRGMMAATGATAAQTSVAIRGAGLTLRAFFATTGIGLVLVGLSLLIERMGALGARMDEIRAKAAGAAQAIRAMSSTEARVEEQRRQTNLRDLRALQASQDRRRLGGNVVVPVGGDMAKRLEESGIPLQRDLFGLGSGRFIDPAMIESYIQKEQGLIAETKSRREQIKYDETIASQPVALQPITGAAADGKGANKVKDDALKALDDRRKYEADLMKLNADQAMKLDDMQFDYWKKLQDLRFDYLEAGQNEWMQREMKFQRDLQAIELRRIESIRRARQETQKAEVEASAAAYAAGGGGGKGLPSGVSGYITGDPKSPFYQADHGGSNYHEHLSFVSRQAAEEAYRKLQGAGIQVTEFMGYGRVGRHTPGSKHYQGLAFDVPGAQVPVGKEPELTSRVQSILGFPGAAPTGGTGARARTEAKQDYRASLEGVQAVQAKERELYQVKLAQKIAQEEINALIAQYVASIAPVEQQKLENSLLQDRIALVRGGAFGDELDLKMKLVEVTRKNALAIEEASAKIKENNAAVEAGNLSAADAARLNGIQEKRINELRKATEGYLPALREQTALQRQLAAAEERGDIGRQMGAAGQGLRAGFIGNAARRYESGLMKGESPELAAEMARLTQQLDMATLTASTLENAATGIGDAFAESFSSVITGSQTAQQALGQMFANVGKMFADMAAQMIAKWLLMKAIGLVGSLLGAGANMGGANYFDPITGKGVAGPNFGLANGGVINGSFMPVTPFATGGMVTGPTLGLVGEGRFNEAVVPLPDGKSIPVSLGEGVGNDISTNIVVNVNNGQASSQINGNGGQSIGRELEGAVRSVILKETRPGGIIYNNR